MTYWETLLTIHQHFSLAVKRTKQRRANRIARYIYYVVRLFAYGYIAWGGWQLATMATQDGYGGYRLIFVLLPLFLIVDYLFRSATTRQEFHRLSPLTPTSLCLCRLSYLSSNSTTKQLILTPYRRSLWSPYVDTRFWNNGDSRVYHWFLRT